MKGKSEALSRAGRVKKANLGRIKPSVVVMGLVLLLLAAATAALVVQVVRPESSTGIEAGLEASSARWSAVGAQYATPDYEAIAAVSSARYAAMAQHYGLQAANLERGEQASTARWVALADYYAQHYAHIADVSSARWQALGEWYIESGLAER